MNTFQGRKQQIKEKREGDAEEEEAQKIKDCTPAMTKLGTKYAKQFQKPMTLIKFSSFHLSPIY